MIRSNKKSPLRFKIVVAGIALGVTSLLTALLQKFNPQQQVRTEQYLTPIFLQTDDFNLGLPEVSDQDRNEAIVGMIVPHHLVAQALIHQIFAQGPQEVERIVLLGPNHHEIGKAQQASSTVDWLTHAGIVPADVEYLTKTKIVLDSELLSQEYSVADLIPYIQHHWPEAKVAPMVISNYSDKQDLDSLAQRLVEGEGGVPTLYIAAVDFSHELSPEAAQGNDQHVLELIQAGDSQALSHLGPDFLDGGSTISLLLKIMQQKETQPFTLVENTDATRLLNSPDPTTTSYITGYFELE